MGRLSFEAFPRATDANNRPVSGGKLYCYLAGTTTPVTTYTDAGMTVPAAFPLVADSAGYFAEAYMPQGLYKIRVTDATGTILREADNVAGIDGSFTSSSIFVTSVSAMKGVAKSFLVDGSICQAASYQTGYGRGGGMFRWSAASTATDDAGLVIAANEGGTGRWLRQHSGTITPWDFGSISNDGGDHTATFTAALNALNADATVYCFDPSGIWSSNGGLPTITKDYASIIASTYCKVTKTTSAKLFKFTGVGAHIERVSVDAGAFGASSIECSGSLPVILNCRVVNGTSNAFNLSGSDGALVAMNSSKDTGDAGFVMGGGSAFPIFALNRIYSAGAEGVTADQGNGMIAALNQAYACGGTGNFGANEAKNNIWALNVSRDGTAGLSIGEHGVDGSTHNVAALNVVSTPTQYGIRWRNYYRQTPITAITKANPCVVTFTRKAITGATQANPCVITCVGHGLVTGDKRRINSVVGMTQLNGITYRIRYVDANSFILLDEEKSTPINATAYTAYSSGGNVDHAFEDKLEIVIRSAGGMTQINGVSYFVTSHTVNTVTLQNADATPLDSTGFSAYTSGGYGEAGAVPSNGSVVGNVIYGSGRADLLIDDYAPLAVTNNVVMGNIASSEIYGSNPSQAAMNERVSFNAALSADVLNVTGNGTQYVCLFPELEDTAGAYDPSTGVFTVPRSGEYVFTGRVTLKQMGGATGMLINIVCNDPWGNAVEAAPFGGFPETGAAASAQWRGSATVTRYLEIGSTVKLRVKATGLGADTADLDATINSCSFSGYARA